jgi:hypothetical protein
MKPAFKAVLRNAVQIETGIIELGAIRVPVVFALSDDGLVFSTVMSKGGVYEPWKELPPLPPRAEVAT